MTNAALTGAALPTMDDTVDGTQIVTSPAARPASRNSDLAAHLIAHRYGLAPHVSRLIAELAGLGGCESRTTASGGKAA